MRNIASSWTVRDGSKTNSIIRWAIQLELTTIVLFHDRSDLVPAVGGNISCFSRVWLCLFALFYSSTWTGPNYVHVHTGYGATSELQRGIQIRANHNQGEFELQSGEMKALRSESVTGRSGST